jgi:hypothetical protein
VGGLYRNFNAGTNDGGGRMNLNLSLTPRLITICVICVLLAMALLVLFGFEIGRRSVLIETSEKQTPQMVATTATEKSAPAPASKP